MSAEATAWAAKQRTGKKTRAKLVLLALAHYADADGCCFIPSRRTLSDFTGQSERTVFNSLLYLEKADLIEREPRNKFLLKIKRPADAPMSALCAASSNPSVRRL